MTASLPPCPASRAGRRQWLATARPAAIRRDCGITMTAVAAALGVSVMTICRWENGMRTPTGEAGEKWYRVVAGVARHAEVTW